MNAKLKLAAASLLLATGAWATEFTLKEGVSGLFDWTDGNNYAGNTAPTQKALDAADRDVVVVPENVTVVISNVMTGTSLDLINSLARIRPNAGARVVFAVEENATLTLDCAVNYDGEGLHSRGTLVKEGAGLLYLSAPLERYTYGGNYHTSFYVDLDVRAGTLKFTQEAATPKVRAYLGHVTLAEGATWMPPSPPDSVASYAITVSSLSGAGTIDTESTKYRYLYLGGGTSAAPKVFSGRAKGYTLSFQKQAYYNLTGTNSVGTGTFDVEGNYSVDGGRIGIRKFGKKGEPSSIGLQNGVNLASRDGFWLTSLRQADDPIDECDKVIMMFSGAGKGTAVLDGGAVGGFRFTGTVNEHPTAAGHKRLALTGANTEECVWAPATLSRKTNAGYPTGGYTFHLTKRGTGTWHFTKTDSVFSGVIAVEEGTLKFDTIKEKGTASTLGTALDLYRAVDAHGVALTTDDQVGYAFLLGDGTEVHEGNFEYSGTADASCTNRPLALNGKGRITNASAKGFSFADVYTVGTGANQLTLDGDDTTVRNELSGIDDAKDANGGPLSIVKDGLGTWTLTGDLALRGSVAVKKGTLVINNAYTWYKWLIKSTDTEDDPKPAQISIYCGDFGLYSADGRRQNLGMTYTRLGYPNLSPGHIDYGFTSADGFNPQSNSGKNVWDLSLLCDGSISQAISFWYRTTTDTNWAKENGWAESYRNVPHCYPDTQPTTWLPIVMRLRDDALTVARWDYATTSGSINNVYRSRIFASVDGENWEDLESADRTIDPSGGWELAGRAVVNGADDVHTNALGEVDGAVIPSVPAAYRSGYLTAVESYEVASGATLRIRGNAEIRGLRFDYGDETGGTIEGATFAAEGTLNVIGFPKNADRTAITYTLQNCTGFGNVAGWSLNEDGKPSTKLGLAISGNTIVVHRKGLMISFR